MNHRLLLTFKIGKKNNVNVTLTKKDERGGKSDVQLVFLCVGDTGRSLQPPLLAWIVWIVLVSKVALLPFYVRLLRRAPSLLIRAT